MGLGVQHFPIVIIDDGAWKLAMKQHSYSITLIVHVINEATFL